MADPTESCTWYYKCTLIRLWLYGPRVPGKLLEMVWNALINGVFSGKCWVVYEQNCLRSVSGAKT